MGTRVSAVQRAAPASSIMARRLGELRGLGESTAPWAGNRVKPPCLNMALGMAADAGRHGSNQEPIRFNWAAHLIPPNHVGCLSSLIS